MLQNLCATSEIVGSRFNRLLDRFRVICFCEGETTDLGGTKSFIVDEELARLAGPKIENATLQQDYLHMSRFDDDAVPAFDILAQSIRSCAVQVTGTENLIFERVQDQQILRVRSGEDIEEDRIFRQRFLTKSRSPRPRREEAIRKKAEGELYELLQRQKAFKAETNPGFQLRPGRLFALGVELRC